MSIADLPILHIVRNCWIISYMALFESYTYGNHPPFRIERAGYHLGRVVFLDSLELPRPEIEEDDYYQALEDINLTWGDTKGVIVDPQTGRQFEGGMANLQASPENGVDVEMSTFTSSLSGNMGNAVELAEHAALHPDRRRLYLASFGNGQSTYWTPEERKYIRRHGRYVQENGEPLPTVASLARALEAADLAITRCFSTDSAGGGYATALMAAAPEGQVEHAYLKSRTNISNHRLALLWGLGILVGDTLDDIVYKKVSDDPWKLTGEKISEAKDLLPNLYGEEAQNRYASFAQKAGTSHKLSKMFNDLVAFSRGGEAYGHPAAHDTVRALQQQPEALFTFHFPLQDRLYNSERDVLEFIARIYDLGRTANTHIRDGQVEALLLPGRHRDHTQYPGLRWATERYAFGRDALGPQYPSSSAA